MDVCKEKHKGVDEKLATITRILNKHSDEMDAMKLDILSGKKDTVHLQDAIKALNDSIVLLIDEIGKLKSKPLEKYEKIGMMIISGIIGYLSSKLL